MGIQSGAPRYQHRKLDHISEKALARAASLDNRAAAPRFHGRKPGWGQTWGVDTSKRLGTRGRWVQRQPPLRHGERARVVDGMRRLKKKKKR
jgi:hypothetical protein